MSNVRVTRESYQARVRFSYDERLVGLIKSLPRYGRRWDPTQRVWLVDDDLVTDLVGMFRFHGYEVVVTDARQKTKVPPPRSATTESWADALMKAVGSERVDPVHRALTRVLHPDVATGDNDLMQALNGARDRWAVTR